MGMILDLTGPIGVEIRSTHGSFCLYGPGHAYPTGHRGTWADEDEPRFYVELDLDHLADLEAALADVRRYVESRGGAIRPSSEERAVAVRMDHTALHFTVEGLTNV